VPGGSIGASRAAAPCYRRRQQRLERPPEAMEVAMTGIGLGTPERPLREIALAHATDKEGRHSYADVYEKHLARLRNSPVTLLEIGVGGYRNPEQGGASMRMWKEYFPNGKIIGIDIEDKRHFSEDRITILQGDQSNAEFLEQLAREYGPFDVVIDDGSHVCAHVIASFAVLFSHVRDGGLYVIEDLQTAYWEKYGGSSVRGQSGASMALLKSLADGLNYAEFDIVGYMPTYTDEWVKSIAMYHNIAFIEKGANVERSNLLPPHPRTRRHYAVKPPRAAVKAPPASVPRRLFRRFVPLALRRVLRRPAKAVLRAARK
jgi:hypothetical protein